MEQVLTVSYVAPEGSDYACLSVMENLDGHIKVLNMFYGVVAELLHRKLVEPVLPFKTNMVNNALMERDHWLMGCLVTDFAGNRINPCFVRADPGVNPFVISKEQLEEILKESVKSGPGELLHNKDCLLCDEK